MIHIFDNCVQFGIKSQRNKSNRADEWRRASSSVPVGFPSDPLALSRLNDAARDSRLPSADRHRARQLATRLQTGSQIEEERPIQLGAQSSPSLIDGARRCAALSHRRPLSPLNEDSHAKGELERPAVQPLARSAATRTQTKGRVKLARVQFGQTGSLGSLSMFIPSGPNPLLPSGRSSGQIGEQMACSSLVQETRARISEPI